MNTKERVIRLACRNYSCGWQGNNNGVLSAPDPFNEGRELIACPKCRGVSIRTCCDEAGCWDEDIVGMQTQNGYRRTCWEHAPEEFRKP